MDGKILETRIFNDRKEAQDFLENLPNEYKIIQRATLRKAIQELETSDCVNEIIVIYMRCNKGNEKKIFYEIEKTDHKLVCVIM